MTLHDETMNIPCEPIEGTESEVLAFKLGHKQALHAAAELADRSEQKLRDEVAALKNDLGLACALLDQATACSGIGPDKALDWWAEKGRLVDDHLSGYRSDETRPKFVHLPDGSSARADKIESVIVRDSDTSFTGKPMVCVAFRLGGDSVDALHFGCETIEAAKELAEKIAADVEAAEADQ